MKCLIQRNGANQGALGAMPTVLGGGGGGGLGVDNPTTCTPHAWCKVDQAGSLGASNLLRLPFPTMVPKQGGPFSGETGGHRCVESWCQCWAGWQRPTEGGT